MANLSIGSSGKEVKDLQNALISAGYNVGDKGADGIFGENTYNAVKAYQEANGLEVDGIAGQNTLGKLYGTGTAVTNTPATPQNATAGTAALPDAVQQVDAQIQQLRNNEPGNWVDPYLDKHQGYRDQIESREPFSFDVNSDPLYEQLKDQFIQQGRLASMDTMGQAAAMTGGYGNSYAQSVGQQVYNQQLGKLNEVVPELYGMAYDRYQQEGQDLLAKYNLYKDLSDQSYDQHQVDVDNWYRKMSLLTGERDAARTEMAGAKSDLINLIAATGYKPTDAELQAAGMTRGQADSYATAYVESKISSPEYAELDYDEWKKDFENAKNPAEVEILEKRMIQSGIDPKIAADWKNDYLKMLEENGYEGHIGTKRKDEIYVWLENAIKNPNNRSSFDPMKLIRGSSFLTTAKERQYAIEVLNYINTLR